MDLLLNLCQDNPYIPYVLGTAAIYAGYYLLCVAKVRKHKLNFIKFKNQS